MEAKQNVNIETMTDLELGLLLESLYQQAFQTNQNIQAVGQQIRNRMPKAQIAAPEQPKTE